jgi:four helix bundle protein
VWNDAIELALRVFRLSGTGRLNGVGDLKNQIERAGVSVSNNIAEGFERGTNEELLTFLYIARGSSGEVRSMLHLLKRLPAIEDLHPQIEDLLNRAGSVSKQLGGWIESIKNSGFKGTRSQTAQTRAIAEAVKRRDEGLAKLRAIQEAAALTANSSTNSAPSEE